MRWQGQNKLAGQTWVPWERIVGAEREAERVVHLVYPAACESLLGALKTPLLHSRPLK